MLNRRWTLTGAGLQINACPSAWVLHRALVPPGRPLPRRVPLLPANPTRTSCPGAWEIVFPKALVPCLASLESATAATAGAAPLRRNPAHGATPCLPGAPASPPGPARGLKIASAPPPLLPGVIPTPQVTTRWRTRPSEDWGLHHKYGGKVSCSEGGYKCRKRGQAGARLRCQGGR